jgi:outer membrane receptor protein involved in Fe transport
MRNIFLSAVLLGCSVSVCVAITAYADDSLAQANDADNTGARSDTIEVVVTGNRGAPQDPLTIPQTIDTVTREDLEKTEYVDIDDAIRKLPNVNGAPAEANPNFWQEGFSIRGLGAQRVLTLTDGVRQAGQGIGYGGGNLSLYDPFEVERIEVLRGPASVLYGTDSFGGVINVITRSPKKRDSWGTNQGARYVWDGSRDMNRASAYLDFGDEDYGAIFGGSYTNADRPNLPDDQEVDNGSFRNLSLWGKTDFHLTEDTELSVFGNSDRGSDILVADSSIGLPIAVFGPPGSSELVNSPLYFTIPEYGQAMAGSELTVKNISDTFVEFKQSLYWQRLYRKFHRETAFYPTFSPGFAGPPTFIDPSASIVQSTVDTDDTIDTYESQSVARMQFDNHAVLFGLDLGLDYSDLPETETQTVVALAGVGPIPGPSTSVDRIRAKADQQRIGVFAQDTWDLDPVSVVPGVRFDYHRVSDDESDFDDNVSGVSGTLGTVYRHDTEHASFLNVATGFRAPDLGERFQNGIVNLGAPTRIIGKNDLDSERSFSTEVGTKGRTDRFTYEVATFYNLVQDYIGLQDLGVSEGFATEQYNNLGTVHLMGAEASGTYELDDTWSIYASGGRTWTKEPERIDVPNWIFNYGPEYRIPVNSAWLSQIRGAVNVRTVLESEERTPSAGRPQFNAGSFTTVDLLWNFDLLETEQGKTGTILAGLRNLADKRYQEPFFAQDQPGRNVYVGVQFEF